MSKSRLNRRKRLSEQRHHTDTQILVLHRAMAEKLLAQPELTDKVRATVEQRYQASLLKYSGYIQWLSILELIDEPEQFVKAMLEDSAQMRKLRRRTPFVGILSEQERQQAIDSLAMD